MYNYPLNLSFKVVALNPQVKITDASGQTVLYVKQKAFALKESVKVFADEAQQRELYAMKANKIMDFSANYNITSPDGMGVGTVKRQGVRSLWKATYNILDAGGAEAGVIREENPWIKVLDGLVSDIPFVGMFINPAYLVDLRGQTVLRLQKQPAVLEGKFALEKRGDFSDADERLLLPSVIMMLMLERLRG
ncbi:MAG: hypothetical protein HY023_11815 [Chloroflexi bacterium]|nr:hypothetical protein [Chloroflexota bacterium]MBI3760820.1 hypothetical protein [Chloroflexota bacterium]